MQEGHQHLDKWRSWVESAHRNKDKVALNLQALIGISIQAALAGVSMPVADVPEEGLNVAKAALSPKP